MLNSIAATLKRILSSGIVFCHECAHVPSQGGKVLELDVVEYCLVGNEGDSGEQRIELASYGGDGTVRFYCSFFLQQEVRKVDRVACACC